jgi:3-dehydroquinate synthase
MSGLKNIGGKLAMNKKVRVELGDRSYNIHIGQTWLLRLPELLSGLARNSQHILISDQIVFDLYGVQVLDLLRAAGLSVEPAVLTGGEGCKTLDSIGWLCEQMLDWGLDRKSSVIALGGGIVGDIGVLPPLPICAGSGLFKYPPPSWPRWIAAWVGKRE